MFGCVCQLIRHDAHGDREALFLLKEDGENGEKRKDHSRQFKKQTWFQPKSMMMMMMMMMIII